MRALHGRRATHRPTPGIERCRRRTCARQSRRRSFRSRASIRLVAPKPCARRSGWCADGHIRGLKLHPPLQQFAPNDRIAYPLYEVFAEAGLPVLFHTGHSGIGTGMPGGGGIRLKYGHPMLIDDVAVDFPELPIILAHPSFPWQDEAISVCLHKPTVYIDLSGWSPKYFSPRSSSTQTRCSSRKCCSGPTTHSSHRTGGWRTSRASPFVTKSGRSS